MKHQRISGKPKIRSKNAVYEGVLSLHPDGYGFVKVEGQANDFFVAPEEMGGAFHGDRVQIRTRLHRGRTRGSVEAISQKGPRTLVATLKRVGQMLIAVPRDGKFPVSPLIPPAHAGGGRAGDLVAVKLDPNSAAQSPRGQVVEVLGRPGERDVELRAVIRAKGLPSKFAENVLLDARQAVKDIPRRADKGRIDLRSQNIFTVDGADAKDFDDAISIERLSDGFRLGVHIADVSSYVAFGSNLDKEAYERGTSVYLPGLVIPMLPASLSDDACSLMPHQDRLTLSAVMDIGKDGQVRASKIFPSIIRSTHRGEYQKVQDVLDGKTVPEYAPIRKDLLDMAELAKILGKRRQGRGALDFNLPEAHVELDEKGKVTGISRRTRLGSHKLIEEFMLAANEAVARFLSDKGEPCLYRIHEKPDPEKLHEANKTLTAMGMGLRDVASVKPIDIQRLLKKVEGKPEEYSVSQLVLRSLKQARYRELRGLHFGLATSTYAHFTSPIRRYPDLVVHRILKNVLMSPDEGARGRRGEGDKGTRRQGGGATTGALGTRAGRRAHYGRWLPKAAEHSSQRERRAQEAEWEALDLKQAEFMKDRVGQSFDAMVSGRTSFGMFVLLKDFFVEGLIHGAGIPGGWPPAEQLYPVGQALRVKLVKVDVALRRIDFALEATPNAKTQRRKESLIEPKKKERKKNSILLKGGYGAKPHRKVAKKKRKQRDKGSKKKHGKHKGRRKQGKGSPP